MPMTDAWPPPAPDPLVPGAATAAGDLEEGLRARLFEQRTIILSGWLDDARAGRAVAELMTLDATGNGPIHLRLDAAGGTVDAAFALIDTIDLCGVQVRVTCLGRAEGPAVGVLAAGHRRAASEHARIRLADPDLRVEGHARDVATHAAAAIGRVSAFHERLARATGRPLPQVEEDCAAGRYLSADEALAYGLVDEIAGRGAAVRPPGSRRLGFQPPSR